MCRAYPAFVPAQQWWPSVCQFSIFLCDHAGAQRGALSTKREIVLKGTYEVQEITLREYMNILALYDKPFCFPVFSAFLVAL